MQLNPSGQCTFDNVKPFNYNVDPRPAHNSQSTSISNRKSKRLAYSKFQFLYKKNRSLACRQVLDDVGWRRKSTLMEYLFWKDVMKSRAPDQKSSFTDFSDAVTDPIIPDSEIWAPITIDEVTKNLPHVSPAAGPDGLTARRLVNTPRALLCRVLNAFVLARRVPEFLFEAKTIFISKVHNATHSGELRPISMSSLLHDLFHRILANRISSVNDYKFQFGFRDFDGTGTCAILTNFFIKYARNHFKNLHMPFVYLKKAFDSVDHTFLWRACIRKGLPISLVTLTWWPPPVLAFRFLLTNFVRVPRGPAWK